MRSFASETPRKTSSSLSADVRFESVSRQRINGISALQILYFRRGEVDTQTVWQVRMFMVPLSGDRWATLTLSNDVSASESIKTAMDAPARTLQLKR